MCGTGSGGGGGSASSHSVQRVTVHDQSSNKTSHYHFSTEERAKNFERRERADGNTVSRSTVTAAQAAREG